MARGKTKMVRISDEKVLKSTFKTRKNGLMKKIKELTILCDIISCVIIYSPVIGNRSPEIFTWPEDQEKVLAAIRMYFDQKHNLLKRTLTDSCENDDNNQVNTVTLSGGVFYERRRTPAEVALAYLNWVNSRIKAVDQRIELVKNSSNLMLFGNGHDQCHNLMFDDKMMSMNVNQSNRDGDFGYEILQDLPTHEQYRYLNFAQYDPYVYDQSQTMYGGRGGACNNNLMSINLVPEVSHFQMCSYDPYLFGLDRDNVDVCLSSVTETQFQGEVDDKKQMCSYVNEWSNPDAASYNYSSSSSNKFNRAEAEAGLDDPLEC